MEPALFVRCYQEVIYRKLWEGIDVVFTPGEKSEMKYTWVVHVGGNPGHIRWHVAGARVRIEGAYLVYETPFGELREGPLRAWQKDGREVPVCWKVVDTEVSLEVGPYDTEQVLYVDPPTRVWGTYYGGSNSYEVAWGCGAALSGNAIGADVYLASDTDSSDLIATTGAHQTIYGGSTQDLFLVKFNASGTRLWGTYYGGAGWDYGGAVACDPNTGDVYLAGGTNSTTGIATAGAHQTSFGGVWDAVLVRFVPATGVRVWGTYYGGSSTEAWSTASVAMSPTDGSIYLTAGTNSDNNISTLNTRAGAHDAFIAKFNSAGSRLWGRYFGGSNTEGYYAVAVSTDANGNPYIASYTQSNDLPTTPGVHQTTYGGGSSDAFVVRFTPAGAITWATYYGGDGDEGSTFSYYSNSIRVVDTYVLVAGTTSSSTGIASPSAFQVAYGGGSSDAFLVCLQQSDGTRAYATYYGGEYADFGYSVAGDGGSGFYLSGFTGSTVGIATAGSWQPALAGASDAFIAKFDGTNWARVWGTYYGGSGTDQGWALVAVGSSSGVELYLGGMTQSSTGIATPGGHKNSLSGGRDAFLVKFLDDQIPMSWRPDGSASPAGAELPSSGSLSVRGRGSRRPVVEVPAVEGPYTWVLYDVAARRLSEGQSEGELPLDLGGYPAGRYILHITGSRLWSLALECPPE